MRAQTDISGNESPPLHQSVVRFILVGILNTVVDFAIYLSLRKAGIPILLANICSTTVALGISFVLNRKYTFSSNDQTLKRQIVRFVPITLIGLFVLQPVIIVQISNDAARTILPGFLEDNTVLLALPKLIATFASLLWNFFWYKYYVFPKPRQ